jgi:hypothetical protein
MLESQMGAADKACAVRANHRAHRAHRGERLEDAALRSRARGERVRAEAQDLIGKVRVIEEGGHIIAEIDGGRS